MARGSISARTTRTPHDLARLRDVDAKCERFEERWTQRQPHRIEDLLVDPDAADRPGWLGELVEEPS